MSAITDTVPGAVATPAVKRPRQEGVLRRLIRRPLGLAGLVILTVLVLLALAAPLLAPFGPLDGIPAQALQPPSADHWMGTDNVGRDVWSRWLHGARISLAVGAAACLLGALVGAPLGAAAGYHGGWVDGVLSWVAEVLLAFPGILLAMVMLAVLGPGAPSVVVAVGISFVPSFLRMARGSVLAARNNLYVDAARVIGLRDSGILFRHILPNVQRPLIVLLTLGMGGAILEGAALSFLGLGVQPPSPEWGAMLSAAQNFLRVGWWMGLFPGLGIFLAVLAVNLTGDALADTLGRR
jgi:peptide/nickel transport system permease protein